MGDPLRNSAQKVQEILARFGLSLVVTELTESTRSAGEAAQAIGCELGQIAKSLVFISREDEQAVLIIASGNNRINEKLIQTAFGLPIQRADADAVREITGFSIGGVPPVGHARPLKTLIDRDLFQYERIWAAAGTPFAVFSLTPQDLLTITGGTVIVVC